jgi:hypothetical protein
MNLNQINDKINSGTYAKNISYPTPFSKGAYLEFVSEWKKTYALLSIAIRANKQLEKEARRPVPKLTDEQEKKLIEQAKFVLPASLGFVQIKDVSTPGWYPTSWRLRQTAHMLLTLRKQMKIEADKSYKAAAAA